MPAQGVGVAFANLGGKKAGNVSERTQIIDRQRKCIDLNLFFLCLPPRIYVTVTPLVIEHLKENFCRKAKIGVV